MKKILLCLCLAFGYGVANDKNGVILGIEFGLSEVDLKASAQGRSGNIKLSAPVYGFKAGYKHFFTDLIGLQGYFSFKDAFASVKQGGALNSVDSSAHFMPLMANADVIFDFYKTNNLSLDAIIGIGLGLAILNDNNLIGVGSTSHSGFYSDARIGLGLNLANNRVGLNAAFPIAPASKSVNNIDYKIKQNYTISLTYDYVF